MEEKRSNLGPPTLYTPHCTWTLKPKGGQRVADTSAHKKKENEKKYDNLRVLIDDKCSAFPSMIRKVKDEEGC